MKSIQAIITERLPAWIRVLELLMVTEIEDLSLEKWNVDKRHGIITDQCRRKYSGDENVL